MPATGRTAAELTERLLAGDKRALARAISLVENDDPEGWALVREVYPQDRQRGGGGLHRPARRGQVHADRRAGGARARGASGRWPCSRSTRARPFTKGALLGDRIRLADHFLDPGVFIRSMASRGSLGGPVRGHAAGGAADGRLGQGRRVPRDRGRGPGRGGHHRPRRHRGARADAGLGRLDPGAQGGRDGDPRRDRGEQVRPPAHRHDDPRDPRRALARPPGGLAGADHEDRGVARRGHRGAGARRSPSTARTSRRRARSRSAAGAT